MNGGVMSGMTIQLMRHLSERLNIGDARPNFELRVYRKDKQGRFEQFPFVIPGIIDINIDRRYNMAADEMKVTILDKAGIMSPDYSPKKEYQHAENLPRSGFKDVLVPFNKVELDAGYGDELRRVFTGQITESSIFENSQAIQINCKNMFRLLNKPVDPVDKKVILYENEKAKVIIEKLIQKAGFIEGQYYIDSETVGDKDFTIPHFEAPLGAYYSDLIQDLLSIMSHRVYADVDGVLRVKLLELYSQKDFHVYEINDYVNMTAGEYNMDSSFLRNRVVIQSNCGWQAFEDPFLMKYCNMETISSGLEVPWCESVDQQWAVADKYFLDMRRKLRRITVTAKGNPTLKQGDLVKMTGLISTMTEKYMVTGIQTTINSAGYLDQIDLEYVGKGTGHICEMGEGAYEKVEGSVSGGGLIPVFTTRRQQVMNYARQWLGVFYQWGGDRAHNKNDYGMDCSHYIWTVLEHFGLMDHYRTAKDIYKMCIPIPAKAAQPGDLIFFSQKDSTDTISHVGMLLGNGKMINAHGYRDTTTQGLARRRNHMVDVSLIADFSGTRYYGIVPGM